MSQKPEEYLERKVRQTLDRIPGYRGYRLKEERRDADRRVRAAVADAYAVELTRVERIGRDLANDRRLGEISAVERASQSIRHYIDRVRAATPGYGGLFGDRDIDGVALDQLRLFDEGLLLGVDELRPSIDRLEKDFAAGNPLAPGASEAAATIETQLARFDRRHEVIDTGIALSRENVLALLQPMAELIPAEAFSARPGDAISILGDDFLVDAMIDVDGRPHSFRVFRIARDPEEWLMVGREPSQPNVRMSPVDAPESGTTIPGDSLRQQSAGTGDGEVVSDREPSGLRAVRYALLDDPDDPERFGLILDWDGVRQAFVGRRIEPIDVEVFRRADPAH
ncbi:MAG: hypothetical protein H0V00_17000 [Chloroflexia bacterium]|nr:hypothetical protein [Chloroflexia bacterium]